jgi:hypothetical protein
MSGELLNHCVYLLSIAKLSQASIQVIIWLHWFDCQIFIDLDDLWIMLIICVDYIM